MTKIYVFLTEAWKQITVQLSDRKKQLLMDDVHQLIGFRYAVVGFSMLTVIVIPYRPKHIVCTE